MRITHNKSYTAEYRAWQGMWTRCVNKNSASYHHYGGRGISVDPSWKSFEAFFKDLGPRPSPEHSIDRIDNNGNYNKQNTRWATLNQQNFNKRGTLVVDGLNLQQWSEITGLGYKTLHNRFTRGWRIPELIEPKIERRGFCKLGHDLNETGRWEGKLRRCRICKYNYDKYLKKRLWNVVFKCSSCSWQYIATKLSVKKFAMVEKFAMEHEHDQIGVTIQYVLHKVETDEK